MSDSKSNYIKNTTTSKERTVRLEIMGEVSNAEKNFLDGIAFFTAGTLRKGSPEHIAYVSDQLMQLINDISTQTRKDVTNKILASIEAADKDHTADTKIKKDADTIRFSINCFIKDHNALIQKMFETETDRKTRPDLIVTMVIGGLAYAVANIYYYITRKFGTKMTLTEYEATFIGMFQAAGKDLAKEKGK